MKLPTTCVIAWAVFLAESNSQVRLESAFPNLSFVRPVYLTHAGDSTDRIFVVSQGGLISVFPNSSSATVAKNFLDIRDSVTSVENEEGLLGLAFHPSFKQNRSFYVNYTAANPLRTVVARFSASQTNPDSASAATKVVLLEILQPYSNHNGGNLVFGPDKYLYIGMGDGGSGGDPQNNGQNNASLLGKLLRINVDSAAPGKNYSIPADNPFKGNVLGYKEEIFAFGFRNPWRFSFDEPTGRLWLADVGQSLWEEIDIVEKGGNYGWRVMEGKHCYTPANGCDTTGLTMPVWEYGHTSLGGFSTTGGYVYRGSKIQSLFGKYVYADYVSGRIWALTYAAPSSYSNQLLLESGLNISSFGVDQQREHYICSFDGKIYTLAGPATEVQSDVGGLHEYSVGENYPNPFNPSTTIVFSLPRKELVVVKVYNLLGQEVSTLVEQEHEAGIHRVQWNGLNDAGRVVPAGVYFYRIKAAEFDRTKRMTLLK